MNRLRILDHLTDEDLNEVIATITSAEKFGEKVQPLTREDLIIITESLVHLANSFDKDRPFSQRQILGAECKIKNVFR